MSSRKCKSCSEFFSVKLADCPHCGATYEQPQQADKPRRPFIDCAHVGCPNEATLRVHTKTGLANLCQQHYVQQYQQPAAEYCERHGLYSVKAMAAHCQALGRAMAVRTNIVTAGATLTDRVPGQDDEEREAA